MNAKSIPLPYGRGTIRADIPEKNLVSIVTPAAMDPIPEPKKTLADAIMNPMDTQSLTDLAQGRNSPCIIVSDSTRPTPSGIIAEESLRALNRAGIQDEKVKIVIATGLHRPCTPEEIVERLGEDLPRRVQVINHDARDYASVTHIGDTTKGTPIWLNKTVHDSDLIIGDGYIEPHFFAGYTGGGKTILPGVSGFETIKANHGAALIDHPSARAGILEGNPIYEEIVEGARQTGLDFSINVTLNSEKLVSGIFAGYFEAAHKAGSAFLDEHVKVETPEADIVVTTNGGYPLDRDLYQAVKGMTVGETAVREGGVVIVASECTDGVGHPLFQDLVESCSGPEEILETIRDPGFFVIDQWEAQILARVLTRCEVVCVTGIEPKTIERMHMTPAADIEEALEMSIQFVGRAPEIVAIPGGPSTIPVPP